MKGSLQQVKGSHRVFRKQVQSAQRAKEAQTARNPTPGRCTGPVEGHKSFFLVEGGGLKGRIGELAGRGARGGANCGRVRGGGGAKGQPGAWKYTAHR